MLERSQKCTILAVFYLIANDKETSSVLPHQLDLIQVSYFYAP